MPRIDFTRSATAGGVQYSSPAITVDTDGAIEKQNPTAAAKTGGTLTGRTDNDTGVVTMPAGHGIITGDKVDIFWYEAGVPKGRRNMTATVAGNDITVDLGTGDNLPALNTTPIAMMKPEVEDFVVTGNNVTGFLVYSPVPGFITFRTAADADIVSYKLMPADARQGGGLFSWNAADGASPLAGAAVAKVTFSHGDAAVQTQEAYALYE